MFKLKGISMVNHIVTPWHVIMVIINIWWFSFNWFFITCYVLHCLCLRFPALAIIVWKTQLWCLTSQALEVTIWRDGMEYEQKYARGNPVTTLISQVLPPELKDHQGTRIKFWPDKEGLPWPSSLIYLW